MIMDTILDILGYGLGYGVMAVMIAGILYVFVKLLITGLDALTNHDD